jgi:hypothetical protein
VRAVEQTDHRNQAPLVIAIGHATAYAAAISRCSARNAARSKRRSAVSVAKRFCGAGFRCLVPASSHTKISLVLYGWEQLAAARSSPALSPFQGVPGHSVVAVARHAGLLGEAARSKKVYVHSVNSSKGCGV